MATPLLERTRDDRIVAGVCAGLADHIGVPVSGVRIAMVVFAMLGGAGALFYVWLWVTTPKEGEVEPVVPLRRVLTRPAAGEATETSPESERATSRWSGRRLPVAELLLGACLLFAGLALVLDRMGIEIGLSVILPTVAVLAGVGLTWWQVADRGHEQQLPRVLGALALVAVGVLMFFVTARESSVWTVAAAALAVLAGVALAIAPWLLRINRELIAEKAAREREAERAEIAAHLHDSVLQTLAAIQQRADAGSDVSRLARAQERELRGWLFRGGDEPTGTQTRAGIAQLREHAATLEIDHAVRFEVVVVGEESVEVPDALVAAAKEAMLNAARHAGGEVTVYMETTPARVGIDVTDRGPGVDLARVPEGRMGVRESIIGRMERAGGTARIVSGPGGTGASVRLELPRLHQRKEPA